MRCLIKVVLDSIGPGNESPLSWLGAGSLSWGLGVVYVCGWGTGWHVSWIGGDLFQGLKHKKKTVSNKDSVGRGTNSSLGAYQKS